MRQTWRRMAIGWLLAVATLAGAEEGPAVGASAPAFELPASVGKATLRQFRGGWLVLVFFPKAFAPRDTEELESLRDVFPDLKRMKADVLAVSMDPPSVNARFRRELKLPFELASDTQKTVSAAYGAMGLGRLFSARKTVLIDPQGRIAARLDKVREKRHGAQVLKALREAQSAAAP